MLRVWIGFLLFLSVSGKLGVATTYAYADVTFGCFSSSNFTFIAQEAYQSTGILNTNAGQNLRLARSRGLSTDIYINHCVGKDPTAQVSEVMNKISATIYNMVWITVMPNNNPGCSWTMNTPQKNCDYLRSLVGAIEAFGKKAGILSSLPQWKQVFQSISFCYQLGNLPLWYENGDGVRSFSDFSSFGGWTAPTMKTYGIRRTMCSTNVNIIYSPS